MPRAVSFDLDGTLYSTRRAGLRLMLSLSGGLRVLTAYQRVRRHIRGRVFEDGEALRRAEIELLAEAMHTTRRRAEERLIDMHDVQLVRMLRKVGPYPAAGPLLRGLRAQGVPVAVLSDLPVERKLAALGLDDIDFAITLNAADTGALKPHSRSFLQVTEALGVGPAELVHVGDRHDTDVVGAQACGAQAVWVCPRPRKSTAPETVVVRSLRALADRWGIDSR